MMTDFETIACNTLVEVGRFDPDDILLFGLNYFVCGWGQEKYYNFPFSVAIALIGSIYGNKKSGRSDYHNGIKFIANELRISHRQIKSLRKKMRHKRGFSFKTPYNIAEILLKIIDLLKDQEENISVKNFLSSQPDDMYREILIARQFEAIKEAAKKGKRDRVIKVANNLRNITTKVGE